MNNQEFLLSRVSDLAQDRAPGGIQARFLTKGENNGLLRDSGHFCAILSPFVTLRDSGLILGRFMTELHIYSRILLINRCRDKAPGAVFLSLLLTFARFLAFLKPTLFSGRN